MSDDAPDWARDMVLTELRRRYPDQVSKDDLQALGIGPDDLRGVLSSLLETGEAQEAEEGYEFVEVEDRLAVLAPLDALGEDEPEEDEPELSVPGVREVRAMAGQPGTYYRVGILIHVTYVPEGEDGDSSAAAEGEMIRAASLNGILNEYPDLGVASQVVSLEAYDNPRQVL